jgi:hypothetical protein
MSKHVPDTASANSALDTAREPSRRDHLPYQVRHLDEIDWETIRWPGETGKMLFHPSPGQPTAPNAGVLRLEPGAHHPEGSAASALFQALELIATQDMSNPPTGWRRSGTGVQCARLPGPPPSYMCTVAIEDEAPLAKALQ